MNSLPIVSPMQVRTKITLCVATLAMVIVACAALLLWNSERITSNHQRTSLAYEELGGYLRLSGEMFRTFKQARRDLMDGDGELEFSLDEAEQRIVAIVEEIRVYERREQALLSRRARDNQGLSRLDNLKDELASAFDDLRQARIMIAEGRQDEARAFLDRSLKTKIDGRVNSLIEAAIADERQELTEALYEIEVINRIAVWAAVLATVLGLGLTALVVRALVVRLRTSLINLERGAEQFAAGQLDHEVPVVGQDEFAMVSRRFNAMARQLLRQRKALEEGRALLEDRVAERTEALRTANAELERRDASRRQFFADIGHELRTPITAVRGEAEVALRSREDHQKIYGAALKRIVGISDQLTRFVNDIFIIAREQAGVLDLRSGHVDLNKLVVQSIEQMKILIDTNHVGLLFNGPNEAALIEGDEQRLGQLLRILLSNAIEHSPVGVDVQVRLRRNGGWWELSIEDNGPGISPAEAQQVFERFYRGGSSGKVGTSGGTGLGLPIARSLVQAHGGRIWIDENYKQGTAMRTTLPALEDAPRAPAGDVSVGDGAVGDAAEETGEQTP